MSAHTPGPWRLTFTGKGRPVVSRDEAPPLFVETNQHSGLNFVPDATRELADAYLIAAAPELLEALAQCADYLDCIPETDAGGDDEAQALAQLAYAVLAKAKGVDL